MEVAVKNEEEVHIKEEVDNVYNETTSTEDPYSQHEHEIKCKLELGPEVLQPRDMVFLPSDWDEFEDTTKSAREPSTEAAPPPFLPEEPEMCFAIIEWQFILSNITKDAMKFYYVIGQLDRRYAKKLKGIITKPPAKKKYDALKKQLIKLLKNEQLGDRNKPSQFLRHIEHLAVNGVSDSTSLLPSDMQKVVPSQAKLTLTSVKRKAQLSSHRNAVECTRSGRRIFFPDYYRP